MPRRKRIKGKDESFYHITSRIIEKTRRFTKAENELNIDLMRRVEDFSGVQVIAYCFMGNHMHLLLRVPKAEAVDDKELTRRIKVLYGKKYLEALLDRWSRFERDGDFRTVKREKDAYRKRMYDMGEFMKTLKQRLTQSYNARNDRKGTLWEERYHSLLLEATPRVLSAVAGYIDLNPVRAHMVSDPKDYAFSSYGEACAGGKKARAGLCRIYQENDVLPEWSKVASYYRQRLVFRAFPTEKRAGMKPEDIQKVMEAEGELTISELLSCQMRYFSTGIALGSRAFVSGIREQVFPRRKSKTLEKT